MVEVVWACDEKRRALRRKDRRRVIVTKVQGRSKRERFYTYCNCFTVLFTAWYRPN